MHETDLSYLHRRMIEEARRGQDSAEISTCVAHRRLAILYRQRIADLESAAKSPPIVGPF